MKPLSRWLCAVIVAGVVLIAGCGNTSAGQPVSAAPDTRSTGTSSDLAPSVDDPRDVRLYGAKPCEIFKPEQVAGFGFDQNPSQRTIPAGQNEECTWVDSGYNVSLRVITHPDSNILGREYTNRSSYPVFEPIEVKGLPAILRENIPGGSRCVVVVGLAEEQGVTVGFTDLREPYEDPCGAARMAAEVAVANLPPLG